eukprot:snap_masked-scaffold287_size221780-processed-gene-0.16 protein:Tk01896 transcript:snap_masked-scaffold287_size221780-processed-gene-0.16-mRNA-1 annotation:"nadph oxidase"
MAGISITISQILADPWRIVALVWWPIIKRKVSKQTLVCERGTDGVRMHDTYSGVSDPSNPEYYGGSPNEERADIVELLEAIAYLICQDDVIRPDTLHRILSSRGVPCKILRLADKNRDGVVSVEEMMNFIINITNPRQKTELTEDNIKHLEKVFRENLAKDKEEFTLAEFKKIVPSKNVSIVPS